MGELGHPPPRPRRRIVVIMILLGLLALSFSYSALAVYKAIDYTTTPGQPLPSQTPATVGLEFEEVTFRSADDRAMRLGGWWIPRDDSRRVLILVHGRYGNRASYLSLARPFWERGFNLLLIDLRGHGQSATTPCSYGLREQWDVVGAVAFARSRGFEGPSIGVMGWSLGGVSALMALEHSPDIGALVSDSAYANADPLLADNLLRPGLKLAMRVVRGVDLDDVRADRALAAVEDRPVFLIHGADDHAVPLAQFDILRAAGGRTIADTWIVPGTDHVGAYSTDPAAYIERVASFFDRELRS
jgi:uncharacterized protein